MQLAVAIIFVFTYLGLALGRLPGTGLDRSGITLVGAVAMLLAGAVDLPDAVDAIDVPTLLVLGAMMAVSALYDVSGLYDAIGLRLARISSTSTLMASTVLVAAALSAVLTNDVVCVALAPVLIGVLLRSGREPMPYLLAFACASNIGSALTPIGNPQNILVAQWMDLDFSRFFVAMLGPVMLSLAGLVLFASRQTALSTARPSQAEPARPVDRATGAWAVTLTVAAVVVFVSPIDDAVGAAAVGAGALVGRTPTRTIVRHVDWGLLLLFVGLFIVMDAFEAAGLAAAAGRQAAAMGVDLSAPLPVAVLVSLLGLVVSNVPAVMALRPFVPAGEVMGWWITIFATFAGNAVLVGSIANLIVAEQAARHGIVISFRRHLVFGAPVTLGSLLIAWLWLMWYT